MEDFLDNDSENLTEKFGKVTDLLTKFAFVVGMFIDAVKQEEMEYPHKLEFSYFMFLDGLKQCIEGSKLQLSGKITDAHVYSFMFYVNEKLQPRITEVENALMQSGVSQSALGRSLNEKLQEVMGE